jgi:hypothetical protein
MVFPRNTTRIVIRDWRDPMSRLKIIVKLIAFAIAESLLLPSLALPVQASLRGTDWRVLESMPRGQELIIQPITGRNIRGKLQSASDSTLELSVNGSRVSVGIADVLRVYRLKGHHIVKGILIGAAVGTGSGAAIGAATYKKSWFDFGRGFDAAVGGAIGLVIGTLTGLTLGAFSHRKELLYEAAPPLGK